MIILTDHARDQAFNRYRFSEDVLKDMCERAISEGFSVNDAPHRRIKKYLKYKKRDDTIPYCWNAYVFIIRFFDDYCLLITTFRLPERYFKYL